MYLFKFKTDFILLENFSSLRRKIVNRLNSVASMFNSVTYVGVVIDNKPTLTANIECLTGRRLCQLCQLCTVCRGLSFEAAWTHVHAFVISHVDSCNSIFGSTSAVLLCPLQSIVNSTAHLIVKIQKFSRIDTDSWRRATLAADPVQAYQQDVSSRLQVSALYCPIVPHWSIYISCRKLCMQLQMVSDQPQLHVSEDKHGASNSLQIAVSHHYFQGQAFRISQVMLLLLDD